MSDLLLYYQRPEPATWVFLSSFLLLTMYFVFHRFFSVRNLDLLLLLLLAPGLMMVYEGRRLQMSPIPEITQPLVLKQADLESSRQQPLQTFPVALVQGGANSLQEDSGSSEAESPGSLEYLPQVSNGWEPGYLEFLGFVFLLVACAFLLIRMLIDPALVRRPLLVPNLSMGGLNFIGISLFLFLMANIVTSTPREQEARSPSLGPGYLLLNMLPALPTSLSETPEENAGGEQPPPAWLPNLVRVFAILSNLAIVLGIVGVGYWHFDNVKTGVGCAVMYLILPYTAQMTGNLQHTVPAAFLVLALLTYRQPLVAGVLLGMASGLVYYPLFLLPLWISFYWYRGLWPFISGVLSSLAVLMLLLAFQGSDFGENIKQMWGLWLPRMENLSGIWDSEYGFPAEFRVPTLVACILLSASFVFWPTRKTLGSLMCGTAAIMLAIQFWHGFGGGLFMAWFLPFILLTIFRPNLDDRIATNVVRLRRRLPEKAPA